MLSFIEGEGMNDAIRSCIGCKYYYVTWDTRAPKGCKYFGFKSIKMPCVVVKESSGDFCAMYEKGSSKN